MTMDGSFVMLVLPHIFRL